MTDPRKSESAPAERWLAPAPLRCRLFGHRMVDPIDGVRLHFFFPSEQVSRTLVARCSRQGCTKEWRS